MLTIMMVVLLVALVIFMAALIVELISISPAILIMVALGYLDFILIREAIRRIVKILVKTSNKIKIRKYARKLK